MKKQIYWLLPVVIWMLFIPLSPIIDLKISDYFYENGSFSSSGFWEFIYTYGPYPAHLLAWGGFFLFILSFFFVSLEPYRWSGAYFALVLLIGAGLVVNVILKDHWGQPRPRQITRYGGMQDYRPLWKPNLNPPEPSKAFPCGHCAMGFYFFCLIFYGLRRKIRCLFWLGFFLTVILGVWLSIARIAQGGHFFYGTVTSALIMWITAYSLQSLIPRTSSPA